MLQWKNLETEVFAEPAMEAKNRSMTENDFQKQLRKTGNTPFSFEYLQISSEGNVFVPNGVLNQLRRSGLEKLEKLKTGQYRRVSEDRPKRAEASPVLKERQWEPVFHVSVETQGQLNAALSSDFVESIYVDSSFMSMGETAELCSRETDRQIYYILPPVFRAETSKAYTEEYRQLKEIPWTGFVVKNLESYRWLLEMGNQKPVVTDANLYTFNSRAAEFWRRQPGIAFETLPVELNARELRERGCREAELIVYGHLPMMTSAGCVYKTLKRCRKREKRRLEPDDYFRLQDRKNMKFAVKPVCKECYNVIYNSQPLSLLNMRSQVEALAPGSLRLSFTLEDEAQTRKVLESFRKNYMENVPVEEFSEFTRGHFKRGVE